MLKQIFGLKDRMNLKLRKRSSISSDTNITGKVKFTLRKANGTVESWSTNEVVASGKEYVASLLEIGSGGVMDYMELGLGSTGVVQGNTGIEVPTDPNSRIPLTSRIRNGTQVTYRADWGVGQAVGMLTEAGLFNSPDLGNAVMFARSVFIGKNKESADSITVEWVITVGP